MLSIYFIRYFIHIKLKYFIFNIICINITTPFILINMDIRNYETWEEYCLRKSYYSKRMDYNTTGTLFESRRIVIDEQVKALEYYNKYNNKCGGKYNCSDNLSSAQRNQNKQRIENEIKEENEEDRKKLSPSPEKEKRIIELIELIKNETNEPYLTELITDYVMFKITDRNYHFDLYDYNYTFKEETYTSLSKYLNDIAKEKMKYKKNKEDEKTNKLKKDLDLIIEYEKKKIIMNQQTLINKQIEDFYRENKKRKELEIIKEIEKLQHKLKELDN